MVNKQNLQIVSNRMHHNGDIIRKNNRQRIIQKRRKVASQYCFSSLKQKKLFSLNFFSQYHYLNNQKHLVESSSSSIMFNRMPFIIYTNKLGGGGNGVVHQAKNKFTQQLLAVKIIKKKQKEQIQHLINLTSPYVVKMHDFWYQTKRKTVTSFIVMERCDCTLREKLQYTSLKTRLQYFDQVVQAYSYLNINKVVHRDLKLQNILIKDNKVKIADFGLAKKMLYDPELNKYQIKGYKTGTIITMAPQVLKRSSNEKVIYTQKCDIWAIGIILHQILYNIHPYESYQASNRRINIAKIYGRYDFIIDKCLIENEKERINWLQFQNYYYNFSQTIKNYFSQLQFNYQRQKLLKQKQNSLEFINMLNNFIYHSKIKQNSVQQQKRNQQIQINRL